MLKDYSEFMDMRMELVEFFKYKYERYQSIVDSMEPFKGLENFLIGLEITFN